MNITGFRNYEEMSKASAQFMVKTLIDQPNVNICFASGGSPERTYELFVQEANDIDHSQMAVTKLDEWCNVEPDSPLSCERFLQERIIKPLNIKQDNYISFQSNANDFKEECQKVHAALDRQPIDLCILGLGKNGHLGLNEPNSYLQPYAHIATLSKITKGHAMINGSTLEEGMSIGMQEIMASKKILLQVSGDGKEEIFKNFLKGHIDPQLPATFLWMHPNVEVYVCEDKFKIDK